MDKFVIDGGNRLEGVVLEIDSFGNLITNITAEMLAGWNLQDAFAVALLSGLAEEALMRAFLQPWIGLLPAALAFGLLHTLPDRRLWLWPVAAFVMGIILGLLYEYGGYPAAAANSADPDNYFGISPAASPERTETVRMAISWKDDSRNPFRGSPESQGTGNSSL